HAFGGAFDGRRTRQANDAMLGSGVDGKLRRTGDAGDGGDIDNGALDAFLAMLALQSRDLVFQRKEHAEKIDVEDAARHVRWRLRQLHEIMDDAGIVDGD